MTVIFDGTSQRQWGRQLFVQEYPHVYPGPQFIQKLEPNDLRAKVHRLLQEKPMTLRQLATATSMDARELYSSMRYMFTKGVVRVVGRARIEARHKNHYSRTHAKVYGLVTVQEKG